MRLALFLAASRVTARKAEHSPDEAQDRTTTRRRTDVGVCLWDRGRNHQPRDSETSFTIISKRSLIVGLRPYDSAAKSRPPLRSRTCRSQTTCPNSSRTCATGCTSPHLRPRRPPPTPERTATRHARQPPLAAGLPARRTRARGGHYAEADRCGLPDTSSSRNTRR